MPKRNQTKTMPMTTPMAMRINLSDVMSAPRTARVYASLTTTRLFKCSRLLTDRRFEYF